MAWPKPNADGIVQKPLNVKIKTRKTRARSLISQPTPIHDYINFKKMSGNEIILNLDNFENLTDSELTSGLLELARRDQKQEFDWNAHPVTRKIFEDLKVRIPSFNAKNVLQAAMFLDRLAVINQHLWLSTSTNILRLLHKYKGADMALFLDLFDKDFLNDEGEPYVYIEKAKPEFFERIVSLLPVHVASMNNEQIIRVLEVLTKRNLGSERLFLHYIYLKIERNVLSFSVDQYCRTVRTLADRHFVEDPVFWHDYIFQYVYKQKRKSKDERKLTSEEAKKIWDTHVYLKLRCDEIDLKGTLQQLEKFMPRSTEQKAVEE